MREGEGEKVKGEGSQGQGGQRQQLATLLSMNHAVGLSGLRSIRDQVLSNAAVS